MTDETDPPTPPNPVQPLGRACLVLGIVSLVRFGPEIVLIFGSHVRASYYAVLAVDVLVALLWLQSGRALLRHGFRAVGSAVVAGGAVFSHGAVWGYFFGSVFIKDWATAIGDPAALAFMGSRLLIYAIEFGFWPFALLRFLKLTEDRNPTLKWSVIRALAASTVIAAALQVILFRTIVER